MRFGTAEMVNRGLDYEREYIAGGYLVTRWTSRPPEVTEFPKRILPPRLVTASDCIAEFLPDWWVHSGWIGRQPDIQQELVKWGIDPARAPDVMSWVQSRFEAAEMGWIYVFFSPQAARDFIHEFQVPTPDLVLLGIGVTVEDATRFLQDAQPQDGIRPSGQFESVSRGVRLAPGGKLLGFEPLTTEGVGAQFHTWLCNSLHEEAHRQRGIVPNERGLLDRLEDARWVADFANLEETGAEPGLWLPWALVGYSVV